MDQNQTRIECRFCKKGFASKSTYGRHLDLKRADTLHPAADIDAIRKNVVRRGENRSDHPERDLAAKRARQKVSKAYNAKEEVKERNKRRRRDRDISIKASLCAHKWYLNKLGAGRLPEAPTFVEMVSGYLPPLLWPKFGEYPGEHEFQKVLTVLGGVLAGVDVFAAWQQWKNLNEDKLDTWRRESDRVIREALGDTSLYEIVACSTIVGKKQQEAYEDYSQSGIFDMIVSDDEMGPEEERRK